MPSLSPSPSLLPTRHATALPADPLESPLQALLPGNLGMEAPIRAPGLGRAQDPRAVAERSQAELRQEECRHAWTDAWLPVVDPLAGAFRGGKRKGFVEVVAAQSGPCHPRRPAVHAPAELSGLGDNADHGHDWRKKDPVCLVFPTDCADCLRLGN